MSQLNMNNRQNGRRRGRNNNNNNNNNGRPQSGGRGGVDQANRIDSRARGNAAQMIEKYRNLARDAQLAGDRVQTEYYLQFADHYFRVISDFRARQEERAAQNGYDRQPDRQREIRGVEDFDGHDDSDLDSDTDNAGNRIDHDGEGDSDNRESRAPREYRGNRDDQRDDDDQRSQRPQRTNQRRDVRDNREPRENREAREPRQQREPREPREQREQREPRAPRAERIEREAAVAEVASEVVAPVAAEEAVAPRRRATRRPRADESLGIDSAALPPAIGRTERASDDNEAPAEKAAAPTLKPRRPRRTAAAASADVEVAE
jgi:hypothetical protein